MIRTMAKSSLLFTRLSASTCTAQQLLLIPAISSAMTAGSYSQNISSHISQSFIFFPALQAQFRGYAPGRQESEKWVPEVDDDLSDVVADSEEFDSEGEDFSEDDEEGLIDEDSVDEDEDEDESD